MGFSFKKIAVLALGLVALAGVANAKDFYKATEIGYYSNFRGGGPSVARGEGYSKKTKNAFFFNGTGKNALEIRYNTTYHNGYAASNCLGAYINGVKVSNLMYGKIHKITTGSTPVYISIGSVGFMQDFFFIAQSGKGWWGVIDIRTLSGYLPQIPTFERANPEVLRAPQVVNGTIIVPYGYGYSEGNNIGHFAFRWDEAAGWYSINHVRY